MPKLNLPRESIPGQTARSIKLFGHLIQNARKKRGMTLKELATRVGATQVTMSRAEKGSPVVRIGIYFTALWVLGLQSEVDQFLQLKDLIGEALEIDRLPKRVRSSKKNRHDNF